MLYQIFFVCKTHLYLLPNLLRLNIFKIVNKYHNTYLFSTMSAGYIFINPADKSTQSFITLV